jgi:hypothetical protein
VRTGWSRVRGPPAHWSARPHLYTGLTDPRRLGPEQLEESTTRPPRSASFCLFEGFLQAKPIIVWFVPPSTLGIERAVAAWGPAAWCAAGSLAGAELSQGAPEQQYFGLADRGHHDVPVGHRRCRCPLAGSCLASSVGIRITTVGSRWPGPGWRRPACRSPRRDPVGPSRWRSNGRRCALPGRRRRRRRRPRK